MVLRGSRWKSYKIHNSSFFLGLEMRSESKQLPNILWKEFLCFFCVLDDTPLFGGIEQVIDIQQVTFLVSIYFSRMPFNFSNSLLTSFSIIL